MFLDYLNTYIKQKEYFKRWNCSKSEIKNFISKGKDVQMNFRSSISIMFYSLQCFFSVLLERSVFCTFAGKEERNRAENYSKYCCGIINQKRTHQISKITFLSMGRSINTNTRFHRKQIMLHLYWIFKLLSNYRKTYKNF